MNDAAFNRDGTRIATVSGDGSARVWNAGNGGEIAVLKDHSPAARIIGFAPDGQRIFTAGAAGVIMWTKLPAAGLPDSIAGLWFGNFGPPNEPAEIIRDRCMRGPIKINSDGLIVFFEAGSSDPPQPVLHLRCVSELTCRIFTGAPGQGLEEQGTGKIEVSGNAGNLCLAGECRPIARCPVLKWTEQERKSGFARQWETEVHAPRR